MVQVKLKNGTTVNGEFIGTYMEHVHLLTSENIIYFRCNDIQTVTKSGYINIFEYDCNENTVSADILFPPQLNPMTGDWETVIPDIFNPKKRKVLSKEEERLSRQKKSTSKNKKGQKNLAQNLNFSTEEVAINQLEKAENGLGKMINPKPKPNTAVSLYKIDKEELSRTKNKEKLTMYSSRNDAITFSEDEIRRFIKKEVRKELQKTLPYEIKKHKEQRQNKIFQNILLGCGVWFVFMIMLS